MSRPRSTPAIVLIAALSFLGTGLACGGQQVPTHDGYRPKSRPWKRPKKIKFDDRNEAEIEGALSYPKRHRARWYAFELPADGELAVKMEVIPSGQLNSVSHGFEVLDENYKVLMRIDAREDQEAKARERGEKGEDEWEEDDEAVEEEAAEELEWERTLYELAAGKYFLHIYLNGRLDQAEYNMRLVFKRVALERESDFPANVAFVDPLPVVPAFDDTPEVDCKQCDCKKDPRCKADCAKCTRRRGHRPNPCAKCDCKGPCKEKCKRKCGGDAAPATTVKARIIRPVASGGGTKITMNRGSSHGIEVGWKGRVVNKAGKGIDGGSFTVTKVKASECEGQVRASPDAVTAAGRAILRPP